MVWINRWTPLIAVLFIINLVLTALYNARKRNADDWSEEVYSK